MVLGGIAGLTGSAAPIFYVALVYIIMSIVLLLPTLAVGIRRMHDINRSGWWFGIIYLLPLLNSLLNAIVFQYASPSVYVYTKLFLAVALFWIPVIFVLALCSLKSKEIPTIKQ